MFLDSTIQAKKEKKNSTLFSGFVYSSSAFCFHCFYAKNCGNPAKPVRLIFLAFYISLMLANCHSFVYRPSSVSSGYFPVGFSLYSCWFFINLNTFFLFLHFGFCARQYFKFCMFQELKSGAIIPNNGESCSILINDTKNLV